MYFSYRNQLRMGLRLLCVYDNMNDMSYIIYHIVTILVFAHFVVQILVIHVHRYSRRH
jgi:hypothetical protein